MLFFYQGCVDTLKEMFPDKTEGDLLAALTENNFDLSETIHEVLSKSEQGKHIFVARLSLVPLQHKDKVEKTKQKITLC